MWHHWAQFDLMLYSVLHRFIFSIWLSYSCLIVTFSIPEEGNIKHQVNLPHSHIGSIHVGRNFNHIPKEQKLHIKTTYVNLKRPTTTALEQPTATEELFGLRVLISGSSTSVECVCVVVVVVQTTSVKTRQPSFFITVLIITGSKTDWVLLHNNKHESITYTLFLWPPCLPP